MLRTLFFVLLSVTAFGQKQGNQWVFGNNNKLDFNTFPPTVGTSAMNLIDGQLEGSASICDSLGQLLFYSDGRRLWDWNDEVIIDTLRGHQSSSHAAYIVPKPGRQNEYYLFTLDAVQNDLQNGLRYSRVIACREAGVTVQEVNVLLSENMSEKMTAIRHQDQENYWLVTHEIGTDRFIVFSISENGIELSASYNLGSVHGNTSIDFSAAVGCMKASPSGELIACNITNSTFMTDVVSFDTQNGSIAELVSFVSDTFEGFSVGAYGLSFSSNSDFLYLASAYDQRVFQFNTSFLPNTQSFLNSRELIYSFADGNNTASFQALQLAVDGKIYLSNFTDYLAVIESPNNQGVDCNLQDSIIQLPNNGIFGLPAFIDSYDYTATGICSPDDIDEEGKYHLQIDVFPNPSSGQVRIELADIIGNGTLLTYNAQGSLVDEKNFTNSRAIDIELPDDEGVYLLQLIDSNGNHGSLTVLKQ